MVTDSQKARCQAEGPKQTQICYPTAHVATAELCKVLNWGYLAVKHCQVILRQSCKLIFRILCGFVDAVQTNQQSDSQPGQSRGSNIFEDTLECHQKGQVKRRT